MYRGPRRSSSHRRDPCSKVNRGNGRVAAHPAGLPDGKIGGVRRPARAECKRWAASVYKLQAGPRSRLPRTRRHAAGGSRDEHRPFPGPEPPRRTFGRRAVSQRALCTSTTRGQRGAPVARAPRGPSRRQSVEQARNRRRGSGWTGRRRGARIEAASGRGQPAGHRCGSCTAQPKRAEPRDTEGGHRGCAGSAGWIVRCRRVRTASTRPSQGGRS